jgi:ATP-dependent RNA helicase DeaD
VADIVNAVTAGAGLDGEAVRNVRVLDRFAFLEVPASDADSVVEKVGGRKVRGATLKLERAKG